jgi:hypothetical protein
LAVLFSAGNVSFVLFAEWKGSNTQNFKTNFNLEQVMKAQHGSGGIALTVSLT